MPYRPLKARANSSLAGNPTHAFLGETAVRARDARNFPAISEPSLPPWPPSTPLRLYRQASRSVGFSQSRCPRWSEAASSLPRCGPQWHPAPSVSALPPLLPHEKDPEPTRGSRGSESLTLRPPLSPAPPPSPSPLGFPSTTPLPLAPQPHSTTTATATTKIDAKMPLLSQGGWTQNKDGSVTCETSPQNVILGQIKNRDNMTMRKNATDTIP